MVVLLLWHSTSSQDSFFTTVFLRYSSSHPLHANATHSWRHCWSDWFQSVVWSHLFSHLRGSSDDGNTCFRLAFVDSNAGVLIRRVSSILLQTYNYSSCDVIKQWRHRLFQDIDFSNNFRCVLMATQAFVFARLALLEPSILSSPWRHTS